MPPIVATLATNQSIPDLRIFLKTLQLWNSTKPPTIYMFGDKEAIDATYKIGYRGRLIFKECLNGYTQRTRQVMERLSGTYGSLWAQFMAEKIALLEWVFEAEPAAAAKDGVFFFDADIAFFGPLPEVPADAAVALSPHMIREGDEAKYGAYNGGFLWVRDPAALTAWRGACEASRFYEQAALEVFNGPEWSGRVHKFPIQCNYGWWRLWQAPVAAAERMKGWGIRRDQEHSGILVEGAPLLSVHTHWGQPQPEDVMAFNKFVTGWLTKLAGGHGPAKALLRILSAQ